MPMILDVAPDIQPPDSMFLLNDTDHRTIWYTPKVWRLYEFNGKPQISYYESDEADLAILQMVVTGWVPPADMQAVVSTANTQGRRVFPARFLGQNEAKRTGSVVTALAEIPDDAPFRCKIHGGNGGALGEPVPIVFTTNRLTGHILRDLISTTETGMVLDVGYALRGTTTTFSAEIIIDYDKTYELLQQHTSWSWWLWSGDIQTAWQNLQQGGAIEVHIRGGNADQKAMVYRWAQEMRDTFFKPTLGLVTAPTMPDTGIIRTALRYEKTREHTHITITFDESDFIDTIEHCPAITGQQNLKPRKLSETPGLEAFIRASMLDAQRASAELVPMPLVFALTNHSLLDTIARFQSRQGQPNGSHSKTQLSETVR